MKNTFFKGVFQIDSCTIIKTLGASMKVISGTVKSQKNENRANATSQRFSYLNLSHAKLTNFAKKRKKKGKTLSGLAFRI